MWGLNTGSRRDERVPDDISFINDQQRPPLHPMSDIQSTPGSSLDHLRDVIAHIDTCMMNVERETVRSISNRTDVPCPQAASDESTDLPIPVPKVEPNTIAESVVFNSDDAILVLMDFYCVSQNPAAKKLFPFASAESRRGNFFELLAEVFIVDQDWADRTIELLGQENRILFQLKQNNSQRNAWYEFHVCSLKLDDVDHVLVVARDISKQKQREHELKAQREFLLSTINAIPEPLSVKTSGLDVVLVNDSFCQTHDVERGEVVGRPLTDTVRSGTPRESAFSEREALATGKTLATIDEFVDANSERFILSTFLSSFHDRVSGKPYVVTTSRDVTTEIRQENRLRLLASVFEAAQEGIAILDPQGAICEANPEFIGTIGKSHATVLGKCLSTVVNCEPNHFSDIIELAQEGRPWFGNAKIINKRHEEITCWLSISPSKNLQGETTNLVAMFSDISQIEETKRELRRQALHDNLTDLPNRRFYRKQIAELIESDTDGSVRFGVSFLDLDDFKIVNDTLGHDAGDQLLVEVSKRLRETLGPECFMARFGGDEFALLIPEQVGKKLIAPACANAVVDSLSQSFNLSGHEVHIGVSIGTTIYPDHATDVESLMRHADVAMYKAKEEGKNKVTFFSAELVEILEKRQVMLAELRQAVENRELKIVYQPKLCLKKNQINSCEALVRWTKPDGTVVSPAEFIPLAEDFGLISQLGDQVLENVCHQARHWHDEGFLSGPIAVNLSPKQLKEPNFIERLKHIIETTQVDPKWIELEITENAVMEDKNRALNLMHQINEIGISIAMDDFGTGYSSLGYIRDFPIRTLKIDMTFVQDLPHCSRAVAIAKTVLSLGHGLNLQVVAEGVETEEQLDFLKQQGCDMAQGYLISRPMPSEEYIRFAYTDQ